MKRIEFTQDFVSSLPKSREQALANGSKYFYDGLTCKNGHLSVRITNINRCFICKRNETKLLAEKKRKLNGVKPKIKITPLLKGEKFGNLTATGQFKIENTSNRLNNRNVNYHEVICSCNKKFWLVSYNWKITEQCPSCWQKELSKRNIKHNESQSIIGRLFYSAKIRAKKNGIKFDLLIEDIDIPNYCPILNIKLDKRINLSEDRKPRLNAPSLDRIDSKKGYIKTNIIVMSYKANVLKKDGTSEEHFKIAEFMEKMGINF